MQIVFQGEHSTEEATETLANILNLFKERYGINNFREMRLEVVMLDNQGDDIELVDAQTSEVFRVFEVYRADNAPSASAKRPDLKLVVDNTANNTR